METGIAIRKKIKGFVKRTFTAFSKGSSVVNNIMMQIVNAVIPQISINTEKNLNRLLSGSSTSETLSLL